MTGRAAVQPAPPGRRSRLALCTLATALSSLALAGVVVLAAVRTTCPPGWTNWDLGPFVATVAGPPVGLLLGTSILATVRARRPTARAQGRVAAVVAAGLLCLLAAGAVILLVPAAVERLAGGGSSCITF